MEQKKSKFISHFWKSIFDIHNQLLASAPEILESRKMKIKYLTNNNKKNNQIKNWEIKLFVNSEKFVVKIWTVNFALALVMSLCSRPHIMFTTHPLETFFCFYK